MEESQRSQISPQRARELINRLFQRLLKIYPTSFERAYGAAEELKYTINEWATSDIVNIDPEQIREALERIKNECDWPPSIAKFLEYCKTAGLPDAFEAYQIAANARQEDYEDMNPVIRVAAQQVGNYELRSQPKDKTWPQFQRAYRILSARYFAGENLSDEIPPALPDLSGDEYVSQEQGEAARAEFKRIRSTLGVGR